MDVPPQRHPQPSPSLGIAIGLMVLGIALGILSVVMVTLPLLRLVRDAPTIPTPGSVTLHLSKGPYRVFQYRGSATVGPVPRLPPGVTALHATDVNISGPGGGAVPVSDADPNETITRGRRHYTSAVAFRVSAPGASTVRIAGTHVEVLIVRSLSDAVRSRVGWVAGIPIGGLLFLIGLVLLIVGIVRRSRARKAPFSLLLVPSLRNCHAAQTKEAAQMVTWRRMRAAGWRLAVLALLAVLAACSKSTPEPVTIPSLTPTPPTTTSTTATATVTPPASPTPTPTKSATTRPTPTATATPAVMPSVQVSEASGATKNLRVGQSVSLRLAQATDGGFSWNFQTKPDPAILAVVSDQTLAPSPAPVTGTVGANGSHRWVFKAAGAGTTSFTVIEQGPGAGAPVMTYSLTVAVSP